MKRPFVTVALLYGSGLLLGQALHPSLTVLLGVSFALTAAALLARPARIPLLAALLVSAGWTSIACKTAVLTPVDLRVVMGNRTAISTLQGRLLETPTQRTSTHGELESVRSMAFLDVRRVKEKGADWTPATGRVLVTTRGTLPSNLFAGQEVEVNGVLSAPPGPLAEGLFDYRTYLRFQGIYYQLRADSAEDWQLIGPLRAQPMSDRFIAWAQQRLASGLPSQDESLRLLWAMTLGWKTGLTNEVYEPFMRSGTMHIFAISGLHIALIAGILVSLLRAVRVSRGWCGLVVLPLIWFYTGATGWQPSAIRSVVMMSIVIGGWSLQRPTDLLNSLAAAAFIILIWDPHQLFGASFQLSFFVVLSIALFMPPIQRWLDAKLAPEPLLPAQLVPRWRRVLTVPLRWLVASVATSLAAWLGSLPLTAYYFHCFSPVTLLANLVIIPLSSLALASNLGSLLCGWAFPTIGDLFNFSAWFWMHCMVRISQAHVLIPFGVWNVPAPSLGTILAYYSLLLALLSGWLLATRRRQIAATLATIILLICAWPWHSDRSVAQLTLLPIQGGMAAFAEAPRPGGDILIDCGDSNSVQYITKPFLRARGVNRLPVLAMTHGDLRHIGGAEDVVAAFNVRRVCASELRFRSPAYRDAISRFREQPGLLQTVSPYQAIQGWTVLHPAPRDRFGRADDGALVLAGTFWGTRVLLLSDLGRLGQECLLERNTNLRADILITGVPSSPDLLSELLLERVSPGLVVVVDSLLPAYARASQAFQERLRGKRIPVLYTRETGATTLEFRPGSWQLRAIDGQTFQPPATAPPPGEPHQQTAGSAETVEK